MIICPKCGHENEMGHVFCTKCGAKLDFTHMQSKELERDQKKNRFLLHFKKLVIAILVVVVVMAICALWPNTNAIGKGGTPVGSRRVGRAIKFLQDLGKNRSVSYVFFEKDINGYLNFSKARELNLHSFSVSITREYFNVRVIKSFGPFSIPGFSFELRPKFSYDLSLKCMPEAEIIQIKKVLIGHLPLFGFARGPVVHTIYKMVFKEKEWALIKQFTKITAEQNKVSVFLKK